MASKLVTDRQKGAESVLAIGSGQSEVLVDALVGLLGSSEAVTPAVFVERVMARLGQRRDAMITADAAHEAELSDDAAVRERRDVLAAGLSARLVELRELLGGLYGATFAQQVLGKSTPKDPVVLSRHAAEASKKLREVSLPPARVAAVTFDAKGTAEAIDAERVALDAALADTAREVREAQVTLEAKTRAMDDYDRVFRGVALALQGLFVVAGNEALAEKVRPSRARPGRTAEQVSGDPAEGATGV